LTESTLSLILESLKDESKGKFLLCGDVNQVIHPSFFSLSKLRSFLRKNPTDKELSVCTLEKNYRNSQQVIQLANRILHLKNYCFASEDKLAAEEKENFFMVSNTKNIGNANFIADDKKEEIAKKASNSTNWAVLVLDDKNKDSARKLFNTPLVFNIHEAKGLEYKNVVLYEFISHGAYNGIWNIAKQKTDKTKVEDAINEVRYSYDNKSVTTSRSKSREDKSFEEFKFYMNALYVGVSRAIDSIYIIGNEKKCNLLKVIKPEGKKTISVDIKKEESTPEEWRNMALELIDKGKIEQARNIVATKLSNKKEYADEIIKELEAKGYHKEQVISELKAEPKKSSMSASKVPKNEKPQDKQHPNEKKKLTKGKLEENTKELFSAVDNDNLQLAAQLIRQGVNINATDDYDVTLLQVAVQKRRNNIVQLLLENGADINATAGGCSDAPLQVAAYNGDSDIVEILLERGAEVDATKHDYIPLHYAAMAGKDGVVALLLKHGADVNAKTQEGLTPLDIAVERGHKNVIELLRKHTKESPQQGRLEQEILEQNKRLEKNTEKLFSALKNGGLQLAKQLIGQGVNIDAKDDHDFTLLHTAARNGHDDVVKLLLKHGASIDARDCDDSTPLYLAATFNRHNVVQILLDNGADVNAKAKVNCTPLHVAAQNGHDVVVKLLLQYKAKVDARTQEGCTPLQFAAEEGKTSAAQLLLEKGADGVP